MYLKKHFYIIIQKPSLKTQRASNADVEALVAWKYSLKRQEPRKKPIVLQDVHTFIDDQQGQIIIIVIIEGQHLRSKCQLAFHS
jgi:hypothetical protein